MTPTEADEFGPVSSGGQAHDAIASVAAARIRSRLFGAAQETKQFGRYRVISTLGAGGQGVVFLADDPELDRRVALKVIEDADADSARRFTREAHVLAKLEHPHVARIFDVGRVDSRMYFAMEYVEGGNLRVWLRRKRSVAEILDVHRAIARALADVHAVGIVHRDIKPENVLVGSDDRPRVADFGLALASVSSRSPVQLDATFGPDSDATSATDPSRVAVGTPAYAAPEVWTGRLGDARSDQFGFCVMLYEALYGRRPLGDRQPIGSRTSIDRELERDLARDSAAPAHVRAAIRRGLSADPNARFATMDDLLIALRGRGSSRRWIAVTGLVAAAAVFAGISGRASAPPICRADDLQALWNDERRAELAQVFDANAPASASVGRRAAAALDEWARNWHQAALTSCDRGQTTDARACLQDARDQFALTIDLLVHADATLAVRAADVVEALDRPATCLDPAVAPRNDDAHARARMHLVETQVFARAVAYADVRDAASMLCAAVEDDPDPRWHAECDLAMGFALNGLGQKHAAQPLLERAYEEATIAGRDPLAFDAARQLVRIAEDYGRRDAAGRWAAAAAALAARTGDPADQLNARRLAASLSMYDRRHREARDELDRLWSESENVLSPPERCEIELTAALVSMHIEGRDAAMQRAERASALAHSLGEQHPMVAASLLVRADVEQKSGAFEAAFADYRAAIALGEAAFDIDSELVREGLEGFAIVHMRLGRPAEGLPYADRAVAIARAHMPDSIAEAQADYVRGIVLGAAGRLQEATQVQWRALALFEANRGADDITTILTRIELGNDLVELGEPARAREMFVAGIAALEREFGPAYPDLGPLHMQLARTEGALGHPDAALAEFDRASAVFQMDGNEDHPDAALVLFNRAEFELELGRFDDAVEHARECVERWRATLGPDHPDTADAEALLVRGEASRRR